MKSIAPVLLNFLKITVLLVIYFALQSTSLRAEQTGDNVTFNFTGKLISSVECKINDGQPIEVDFGKVGISEIDSNNYRKSIRFKIDCGGVNGVNGFQLLINGPVSNYDLAALSTNIDGLGVRIEADGNPVKINEALSINPDSLPNFEAVLVKDPLKILSEQPFSASATLWVEFI